MNACVTAANAWPPLSVPGMTSSGTSFHSLKAAVVGANEPMPSVSKKFVTKPIVSWSGVGGPSSRSVPSVRACVARRRHQKRM